MNFDIDKILNNEYLDRLLSEINKKIDEINSHLLKNYSFDELMSMNDNEINVLFNKYGVSTDEISRYKNSSFSMLSAYSDLFPVSSTKSLQKRESSKQNVQKIVDELNHKINLANDVFRENINKLNKTFELVKEISNILKLDEVISEDNINNLRNLIINSDLIDEDKFNLSYIITKYLISKNITLLDKKAIEEKNEIVDTDEFESALTDVYEETDYGNVKTSEEVINEGKESTYIDLILKYYKKYEQLFKNIGLGENLEDTLIIAQEISADILIDNGSVSKEDFGIQVASLLYILKTMDYDADIIASAIEELDELDKIYDEYTKISDDCKKLLDEIKETIVLLKSSNNVNFNMKDIITRLDDLVLELRNNVITDNRRKSIVDEYNSLKRRILVMKENEDVLSNLDDLRIVVETKMSMPSSFNQSSDGSLFEKLVRLQDSIITMIDIVKKNGVSKDILESVKKITNEIASLDNGSVELETSEKITLKGFVLFDFDEDNVPYVISDLDLVNRNNLVDKTIEPGKLNSGYKEYDKLIGDLLTLGTPEILAYGSPSYLNKIVTPIFRKSGLASRTSQTGMLRFRPHPNSVVRFIEQKVVLHQGTEIYEQVIDIIREMLPNVSFVDGEDFQLYINFASGMKYADSDIYTESIKRYDRQSMLYKLFLNNDKDRLTDKECDLLREIIKMTLNAYSELAKKNPSLEFDIIEKIGGMKKHGL